MKTDSNTIFITGGSSGIGRGLAEAFHKSGNHVIIGARREASLKSICAANSGMAYFVLDVTNPASVRDAARDVTSHFPDLNCVVNAAGVQREHDFSRERPIEPNAFSDEIDTNLTGLMRVCAAFLPYLRKRERSTVINISSGLALVPLARVPVYCATKAAVHSFSLSLRRQLRDTTVRVIELIPPYVDTELDKGRRREGGPQPMPLDLFIGETMAALAGQEEEIVIGNARFLRNTIGANFAQAFSMMNG